MGKNKFNAFGFKFDDLGKAVDDFIHNINVDNIFGADCTRSLPAINAIEYPTHLELQVAAPGLKKEDFELHVENEVLTISAKATEEELPEDVKIRRKEFNYSTFERTFCLSNKLDYQKITAKYEQGILVITVPQKNTDDSSKIKVEVL